MNPNAHSTRRLMAWSFQEIKQGHLWPISFALVMIIASVFALSALGERIEQVVVKQGKEALTADLVYRSSNPVPETLRKTVAASQVEQSNYTRFATMTFSDNGMMLVTVKAVDSKYPLLGELALESKQGIQSQVNPGELWLDQRILTTLDAKVGDEITLGDSQKVITGVVKSEPGLSFNPFQQMPAAYIHLKDVNATGAIQVGSRVQYRVFLTGPSEKLAAIKDSIELTPSDRWLDENRTNRSGDVFESTQQYLSLTVALVIIMATTTLILTFQNYVASRRQTIAMLKSLGASKVWISRWLVIQIAVLFVIGAFIGVALGMTLEFLLRIPLQDLLPSPLPSYGVTPFVSSMGVAALVALPALGIPLLGLVNTSAANVMQDNPTVVPFKQRALLMSVPALALIWTYYDNTLVWIVLLGIAVLFTTLAAVSMGLTQLLARMKFGPAMTLALNRINRSPKTSGIQYGALGLSLMLLATIWLVRTDLLSDWARTLPADAANVFSLNIAEYEKDAYLSQIDGAGIERSDAYPIIRGRLSKVNQLEAKEHAGEDSPSDAIRRELNFTWADGIPDHNIVIEGAWTNANGVSVEQQVAEELKLTIGDELTFVVNSVEFTAVINSIRKVEWRDMKPNFYFIFSPDVMASVPASYLVSFRVNEQHQEMLNQLARNHPTVSLMDLRSMGEKIQSLIGKIVSAITILAGLGVIAGIMLIFTLLRLSLEQRQQEIRLYRTLGASRARIRATIWAEYGIMALVASLVASLGAEASVAALMSFGFELESNFHPSLWIVLPLVTFVTLALAVNSLIKRLLIPMKQAST